ncbi:ZYRO0B02420p [Zygosaccharomyces rouxii]|uniref:ZYRO0B02420p n=2 Tax=Zygosaccharomyces rouxii TaxID=4956 RepID=C5DQR6_ZYGRC|nr:uncharacterized protein ZYRO0B02420g [Zygosaccharomyces rouxii]KAH9200323.1 hypothetical protein LQ764DRAFT_114624 [Zygosaccharomyces rouxii]CAR26127.1 ZYRO0B02420p [Zygosaccharomyces rouxii]
MYKTETLWKRAGNLWEKVMVRYDKLLEFIETLNPPSGVRGIPESITKSLQPKQSRSSVDELCKKVYQVEKEERRQQLLQVLENVGDMPQSMLGYDIREATSIDRLSQQVCQLPRLTTLQDNQEDQNVLQEYNYLRDQIIQKCKAIEVANKVLDQSGKDLKTIESLLQNLPDPERFFSNYHKTLDGELKRI